MTDTVSTVEDSSAIRLINRHHGLLRQLVSRDVKSRYRGSLLGVGWAVIHPLLLLGVYTFVFSVVFKARFNGRGVEETTISFAVLLYSGLILHALLADVLNRSTSIILQHCNYVKKVVFPLAILPVMVVSSTVIMFVIQSAILLVAMVAMGHAVPLTALLFPLVVLPLVLLSLGLSWFTAAIGVYVRDLAQIMGLVVTLLLFLSPIFYSVSALPEPYQKFIYFNPLTSIIENARAVLLYGELPDWEVLGIYTACSLVVCRVGYWWFYRTRKGFNDVL